MSKNKRSLEDGGIRYNTTGGAGYIPPEYGQNVVYPITNMLKYIGGYLGNKFFGQKGTFIDLSNKNVSRIKSNTKNIDSILTNDFVEGNKNAVRKKKDFINTSDSLLGDKRIPLSKISTYYGIEGGKLKAGSLDIFNDDTVVIPNRAKRTGKLKEIILHKSTGDYGIVRTVTDEDEKVIDAYNKSKGYVGDSGDRPSYVLRRNEGRYRIFDVINNFYRAVTENGDTIPLPDINAKPKVLFADEYGNSAFISNIKDDENRVKLNKFLSEHPSYPIMVDNGRYATYQDKSPNLEEYVGFSSPDDMFILGTTRNNYEKGGSIHIAPSKRGTFTAAATKHGMGVQAFARRVLANKGNYSPAMVKKANLQGTQLNGIKLGAFPSYSVSW